MADDRFTPLEGLKVDDVEGIDQLFENVELIGRLKHAQPGRYERLRATWKARGVPRLPQLEKAVDDWIKRAVKQRVREGRAGKDGFIRDGNGSIASNRANI